MKWLSWSRRICFQIAGKIPSKTWWKNTRTPMRTRKSPWPISSYVSSAKSANVVTWKGKHDRQMRVWPSLYGVWTVATLGRSGEVLFTHPHTTKQNHKPIFSYATKLKERWQNKKNISFPVARGRNPSAEPQPTWSTYHQAANTRFFHQVVSSRPWREVFPRTTLFSRFLAHQKASTYQSLRRA